MGKRDMGVPVGSSITMARKVPKKIDLDKLADAIVDGKLIAPFSATLIIERTTWTKGNCVPVMSFCTIKNVGPDGIIYAWDETRQQIFMFNVNAKDLPRIKIWENETDENIQEIK